MPFFPGINGTCYPPLNLRSNPPQTPQIPTPQKQVFYPALSSSSQALQQQRQQPPSVPATIPSPIVTRALDFVESLGKR